MSTEPITQDATLRSLCVATAEIAESLRDLCFSINMPPAEGRVVKIAGCVEGIERALRRIEANVLRQTVTKIGALEAQVVTLTAELEEARRALAVALAPPPSSPNTEPTE